MLLLIYISFGIQLNCMKKFKLSYEKTYGYRLSDTDSKDYYDSTIEAEKIEEAVQKAERKLFRADFSTSSSVTDAILILPNKQEIYFPLHSKKYFETTKKLFEAMKECAVQASQLLLEHRGKTPNIGKETDHIPGIPDRSTGTALTFLDSLLQEMFLKKVLEITSKIDLNVEEKTPIQQLFQSCPWLTLHCDPLDNTRAYIQGGQYFSSGYGLSDVLDRFTHTVVSAPTRGVLYTASPDGCDSLIMGKRSERDSVPDADMNIVLSRSLLSEKGESCLRSAGFTIEGIRGAHLSIIDVALGNVGVLLYGAGNVHDVLLPYAFAKAKGATLTDARGKDIVGKKLLRRKEGSNPLYERIPSTCYFASAFSKKNIVLDILSSDENLHPAYLRAREREK